MSQRINVETITPAEYREWLENEIAEGRKMPSEKSVYHVRVEHKEFDPRTGEKLSQAYVQYYNTKEWRKNPSEGVQDYLIRAGYEFEVLFNPTEKPEETEKKAKAATEKAEMAQKADVEEPVEVTEEANVESTPEQPKRGRKNKENK